jgi:CDP-diacylglycerol--glycerol-3-phosphate 3-phosphatidyltransferase
LLSQYRAFFGRIFTPLARTLLRAHVSPDVVTVIGTVGVSAAALYFFPRGQFFVGTVVITAFVFSDTLDGTMARLAGRSSRWGAFLDSTLDRVSDAAVFGGLLMWYAGEGDDRVLAWVCLVALVGGVMVSYTRSRAESLGLHASVGIAERSERLVTVLIAAGLSGLGVPYLLEAALWVLAFATWITTGQRMLTVYRQINAQDRGHAAA